MSHWKTDRGILEKRFPELLATLSSRSEGRTEPDITFALSASGQPTATIRGHQIHSRHDPVRESTRLAALVPETDGPVVILGFGLGYGADALQKVNRESPFIVVERHPELLLASFRDRDLSTLISREKLAFLIEPSPDALLAVLEHFGGKPTLFANRALCEADREFYDGLEAAIARQGMRTEVNAATLKKFGRRWVRNLGANLPHIRDVPGISRLEGVAEGLPALVVAAGPSLDTILPVFPSLAERCIIIAVDTALRAVLSTGVEPDFVVVVDPQFWNARHLDRAQAPHSALVTESATYPSVLREPFQRTFFCSSLFPLGAFIEKRVDPKGVLGAGGSVATTALDFARSLGASPLFVAGLDLAFPDRKTHFHGALFEERVHGEEYRLVPGELRSVRALRDGQPFTAPAANGGTVLTDKRLALYASWFASWIARNPHFTPTSLSDKGIRIEGMRQASPSSLLALPACRTSIAERLAARYDSISKSFSAQENRERRGKGYEAAVRELAENLDALSRLSRNAQEAAERGLAAMGGHTEDREREVAKALDILEKTGTAIEGNEAKEIAGFLIPAVTELESLVSREKEDKLGWHLDFSRLLFKRLAEDARYHEQLIKKS